MVTWLWSRRELAILPAQTWPRSTELAQDLLHRGRRNYLRPYGYQPVKHVVSRDEQQFLGKTQGYVMDKTYETALS